MRELNSIELFAGAGGLAIGLHGAGFSPKAIVEFMKMLVRPFAPTKYLIMELGFTKVM